LAYWHAELDEVLPELGVGGQTCRCPCPKGSQSAHRRTDAGWTGWPRRWSGSVIKYGMKCGAAMDEAHVAAIFQRRRRRWPQRAFSWGEMSSCPKIFP
jgi:hypothetical protein